MRRLSLLALTLLGCWSEALPLPYYDAGPSHTEQQAPTASSPPSEPIPTTPAPPNEKPVPPASPFSPVIVQPKAPAPVTGGTLTLARDNRRAIVADPDRDRVSIVELVAGAKPAVVTLKPGDEPGRSAEDGKGRAHVLLRGSGELASIDIATASLLARRAVCPAPRGIAWDRLADRMIVACAGGELVALSPETGAIAWSRRLPDDLRDVLIRGSRLFVTRFRSAQILELALDGTLVKTTATPPLQHSVAGGSGVIGIRAPGGVEAPFVPNVAWRAIGIEAGVLVLHQRSFSGPVGPISESDAPVTGAVYYGSSSCDSVLQSTITVLRDDGGPVIPGATINGAVVPVDVAATASGQTVAILSAGSTFTAFPNIVVLRGDRYRSASSGCVGSSASTKRPTGQPIALALDGSARMIVQSRQPAALDIITMDTAAEIGTKITIPLGGEDLVDTGQALFHVTGQSAVACASCHPEGSDDGITWSFAKEGKRRTQDLRGGFLATAPFHWNGDVADMNVLMKEVFETRMRAFPTSAEQRMALAKWLDQVGHPARAPAAAKEVLARGEALFAGSTLACASCHSGARFTSAAAIDVGTGGKFDVPSLNGLVFRPPYLHDGCAKDLADVFSTCAKSGAHAKTAALTAAQADDLAAYLRSL